MPVPQQEVVVEEIKEPIPEVQPVPVEPPPPERSPSPADEVIEPEPLKYTEGVSRPFFHVNIKGNSHGGLLANISFYYIYVFKLKYFLINSTIDKIYH